MNSSLKLNDIKENSDTRCSLSNGSSASTSDSHFVKNLPPHEVHARALAAREMLGRAEKTLVSWLIEINDRKLYQHFSCSSIYHYASRYLKLAEHTVAEYLRTGRTLADLPLLSSAFEKGELSSTHIREITRVATPATENFWYETAKNCTTRKIEKLVAFTPKGGLPPVDPGDQGSAGSADSRESLQCRPASIAAVACDNDLKEAIKYHDRLVVELSNEEMGLLKDAFDKARKESGKKDRASLLVHMARVYLEGASPGEARKSSRAPYQVVYHHHLPSGLTWCITEKGERPVTPQALERALCDAEITYADESECNNPVSHEREKDPLRDPPHPPVTPQEQTHDSVTGHEPVKFQQEGMEYVNELYGKMKQAKSRIFPGSKGPTGRSRKTIPPHIRKKVLERDGHCCLAPGCGRALFTVLHHLTPAALGGSDEAPQLITLCWSCHDLVHEGKLSVKGEAPGNLVWG
jgi:hypothetical protein